jgi:tetratricopeptide (TPR) repeat protein
LSKLFDTLEQIRRHESSHDSGHSRKNTPARSGKLGGGKAFLIVALLVAAAAVVVYFSPLRGISGKKPGPAGRDQVAESDRVAPALVAPSISRQPPAAILADQDLLSLNNSGVEYVRNNDPWRGIYLFSRILDREPGRIEAMINIGAALAELGLIEPAKRYFRQAAILDRNHPALRANVVILRKAGLVGDDFFEPVKTTEGKP